MSLLRDIHVERHCEQCGQPFMACQSDLKRGKDRYCSATCKYAAATKRITRECLICGQPFETLETDIARGKGIFCSDKCFRVHKNTRVELTCEHCGKIYSQKKCNQDRSRFCSRACQGAWKALQNYRETDIEQILSALLVSLNIDFESQKPIGPFVCDFYIPSHHLVIEADGEYWHSLPENMQRDKRKNYLLCERGYKLLRLSGEEIRNSPERCTKRIRQAIKQRGTHIQLHLINY